MGTKITAIKEVLAKVDYEGSKKFIGKRTLSVGELFAFILFIACIIIWNRDLVSKAKLWKFWLPFVIFVVAVILW